MNKRRLGTVRDWLIVLASLLDDAAVLVLIILALRYFRVGITLPLIIVIALLFVGYVLLVHRAIVPSLRRRKVTGAEGMIGLEGTVVEPLRPVGLVKVGSECWKARSAGGEILAGESVEIMGTSGLTLEVRRKTR